MTDRTDELLKRIEKLEADIATMARVSDAEFSVFEMTTKMLLVAIVIGATPEVLEELLRDTSKEFLERDDYDKRVGEFFKEQHEYVRQIIAIREGRTR